MKRLLLAALALGLLSSTASARVWIPGTPEWSVRFNCANYHNRALMQAGDLRWRRLAAMRRAGMDVRYVRYTREGQSLIREADRYCAARGQ
jgi:hypothetical protein